MNKFLVGVSGGPDSMMLLDSLIKAKKEVVVAHVNYQRRSTAFNDEALVAAYCKKHGLMLERCYPYHRKGNFQNWARHQRYHWFAQLAKKHNCEAVAVGHQLNDLVETYLIQKERKAIVAYYGLAPSSKIAGMELYRPLLEYSREEVLAYCQKEQLQFAVDESNDSPKYRRNAIRQKVGQLSKEELLAYRLLCEKENCELEVFKASIPVDLEFERQTEFTQRYLLSGLLKKQGHYYFSVKHLEEICRQLLQKGHYKYHQEFIVEVSKGLLHYSKLNENYSFQITDLNYGQYGVVTLAASGEKKFGVKVLEEDWPLTIRNWQAGDYIEMVYGRKKVNRLFIDNKIPCSARAGWPIVLNRQNSIILVPGLAKDIKHLSDKENLYVIKL